MTIELRCPEDLDVLKKLQRQERNAKQRNRYRAVLLALNGKMAPALSVEGCIKKLSKARPGSEGVVHSRNAIRSRCRLSVALV